MGEPTNVSSVYDLVLEIAIAARIAYYGSDGQQRAMVPANEHDFEKCMRVINNGIRRLIHDAPDEGWHWMERFHKQTLGIVQTEGTVDSGDATTLVDDALSDTYDTDDEINGYYVYDTTKEIYAVITDYTASTGTITISGWLDYLGNSSSNTPAASDDYSITDVKTVAGDKTRYFLPDDFSEVDGPITYQKGSGVGHIQWVTESDIRHRQEVTDTSSHPTRAAIRSILNRKHELVLDPSPTSAETLEFRYRAGLNKLNAIVGIASDGSTTTIVDDTFANKYPDDYFNGWYVTTLDGTGKYSYAEVTDFTGSTCTFTVADWLSDFDKSTSAAVDPASGTFYFVTDGLKHAAGLAFDHVVRAAILAEAQIEFGEMNSDYLGEYLEIVLPGARMLDARQTPRRRGHMRPGTRRGRTYSAQPRDPYRTWTDVTYS